MKSVLLFLFLSTALFAGDDERLSQPIPTFLQAELLQAYNSVGFSNLLKADAVELAAANPASIVNFKRLTFGMAFEYRTELELYYDIKLSRSRQWYPVSAALVVPLRFVHLALTYQNRYSKFIDYGNIEINTIEEPEGTGEFINPTSTENVHSFGTIIGKEIQKLLFQNDRLAIAAQLMVDYFYAISEFGENTVTLSDFSAGFKMGLLYNLNPAIGIGFLFDSGPTFEGKYDYGPDVFTNIDSEATTSKAIFADKMAFGLQIRPLKQFSITTSWEYIFYEQINSNIKNALNFSIGMIYRIPGLFDLSTGMYDSNQSLKDGYLPNRDATFLNLGIRKRFSNGDVRLEVYDSHYFSTEIREQTIVKLGFNIAL